MASNVGRGIIAPDSHDTIGTGASEMRRLGATTAAAISDVDVRVSAELAQKIGKMEAYENLLPRDEAVRYGIEGPRGRVGPVGPKSDVPGPGGSIALEETDPGCFVDSEVTWMQWPQSGGLPAVWNPNTQAYENPIRVDTSVGTRVFVGDTMIYGDTGWREISLANGWTGTLLVRRTGNLISWKAHALNGANATSGNAFFPPFGFQARPRTPQERPLLTTAESPPTLARTSAAGAAALTVYGYESLGLLYGSWSWITENDWPSTLPGEPA